MRRAKTVIASLCGIAFLASAASASADVRDGVEAWSAGDFETAVNMWSGPASTGDPDALFNLGQAYRLGRGVPRDMLRAEEFYRQAAEAGHFRAADTYGLMLFQSGRHEEAMPYVVPAAGRGDPRAQYLLGIAHFNGRLVERDWEKAYALLTLANGAGLPQAASAITRMDRHIPLDQRQNAAALAITMQAEAEEARNLQFASADLGVSEASIPSSVNSAPRVAGQTGANSITQSRAVPQPIATAPVTPSVVASSAAVREARMANGTASPANAGASYARPQEPLRAPVQVAVVPSQEVRAAPRPAPVSAPVSAPVAPEPASRFGGDWRVQLGAFGVKGNAERLWNRLSSRPELQGSTRMLIPAGAVTKLQAGGFASRAAAQEACNALKAAGQDCLVTR